MYKYLLFTTLVLGGCSNFTVNGTMCDRVVNDRDNRNGGIPQECKSYNDKEADKAFNKIVDEKKVSNKDIEFNNKDK
jgi:hypothetical protein